MDTRHVFAILFIGAVGTLGFAVTNLNFSYTTTVGTAKLAFGTRTGCTTWKNWLETIIVYTPGLKHNKKHIAGFVTLL